MRHYWALVGLKKDFLYYPHVHNPIIGKKYNPVRDTEPCCEIIWKSENRIEVEKEFQRMEEQSKGDPIVGVPVYTILTIMQIWE